MNSQCPVVVSLPGESSRRRPWLASGSGTAGSDPTPSTLPSPSAVRFGRARSAARTTWSSVWAPASPPRAGSPKPSASGSAPTPTESRTISVTVMTRAYGAEAERGMIRHVDLAEHVARELAALAPRPGPVLVAVSGGGDSVALLMAAMEAGIDVVVAHLDHGLRGEGSREDARFVADLAARLGVPLVAAEADVAGVARERGWNVEDAARRVRYGFLHRAAREHGCGAIAVAHTRDDQAETFLLQALRGSALPAGMPKRRGLVVRPLLDVPRAELRAYLESRGAPWREDPTNLDTTRARAWLRGTVMPLLEERYPGAAARLAATAGGLRDVRAALAAQAAALVGEGDLDARSLAAAPAAVQRFALA